MEDISSVILDFAKYGIVGMFLVILIFVVKNLYTDQKKTLTETISDYKLLQTEFKDYMKATNETLFEIVKNNTTGYEKMATVFEKTVSVIENNTAMNEKTSYVIERKIDAMKLIKKLKIKEDAKI
jgi:hypothetical protein